MSSRLSRQKQRHKRKEVLRARILEILLKNPCKDCGNADVRVLEFDHIGDKTADVCRLLSQARSWSTIEQEIAKCEVVCSNCHKIRTCERKSNYKSLYVSGVGYGVSN